MQIPSFALALLASAPLASAHFKIINATGDMGGNASALGVKAMDNSQDDVTRFKRKDDKSSGNLFGTVNQACNANPYSVRSKVRLIRTY